MCVYVCVLVHARVMTSSRVSRKLQIQVSKSPLSCHGTVGSARNSSVSDIKHQQQQPQEQLKVPPTIIWPYHAKPFIHIPIPSSLSSEWASSDKPKTV